MPISNQFTKIPKQDKTISAIMDELARQYKAVDLSKGYAEFDTDTILIELVYKNLKAGFNKYAPIEGILSLREALTRKIKEWYEGVYDAENEITITSGATAGIFTAISSFIRENDEVIIFEPSYDSYAPAVKLNGGIPVYIDNKPPMFAIDWEQVQRSVTANTRMIIINNPHNPTGRILLPEDIEKLKRVINGTNILILSDEVFEHVIFDGNTHESLLKYPELKDRTIVVNSFGKTYNATGWHLGYAVASKEMMLEFRKVHRVSVFAANSPMQYAFNDYLANYHSHSNLRLFYQKKRDFFISLFTGTNFVLVPPQGTFFQCIDFSKVTNENDFEYASRLVREFKVATLPLSYMYKSKTDNKILRINFAQSDEILEIAAQRIIASSK